MGYFPPLSSFVVALIFPFFASSSSPPSLNPSFPFLSSATSFHVVLILILVSPPRFQALLFSSLFLPLLFAPVISRDLRVENKGGVGGEWKEWGRGRGGGREEGGGKRQRRRQKSSFGGGREPAGGNGEPTAGRVVPVSVTAN